MDRDAVISVKNLVKSYAGRRAVDGRRNIRMYRSKRSFIKILWRELHLPVS